MLDIKFVRENPEIVKQNIRNKFQDSKLELVDKVLELDKENRAIKQEVEALRAQRNKISKQIGALMGQGKKDEAEEIKKKVAESGNHIEELSAREKEVEEEKRDKIDEILTQMETKETYATYKVYIVRENDTLETIMEKYDTTRELLSLYNDLNEIKLGDKIMIPSHDA